MADEVDTTTERLESEVALIVGDICRKACCMPKGEPGECYFCGEVFSRVVAVDWFGDEVNACGKCRDLRGIK